LSLSAATAAEQIRSPAEVEGAMTVDDLIAQYRSPHSAPPILALAGLDEVDWSAVSDAYGPASDIPALLRAAVSGDPVHRDFAYQLLHQTIWHQGNVYSATATAIPLLYNLLEADGPHDKEAIAGLLALIADGQPPFLQCETDPKAETEWRAILSKAGRSLDAKIAESHKVAEAIRQQLARRPDLLSFCLRPRPDDEADGSGGE
jgi:hypothetical protein